MTAAESVDRVASYDDRWARITVLVQARLAAGEVMLSRVLRQVEADFRETADLAPVGGTALGRRVDMPTAALIGGRQALWRQILLNECRADTSLVVEVGAGWGINLLDLFVGGGPREARYVALEPSPSGRETFNLLVALEPSLEAKAAAFDYHSANYSVAAGAHHHALAFTSHSIEQIGHLPRDALIGLLDLADEVTVVHLEPVGWQIREQQGLPEAEAGATRERADRKSYNRNLFELVRSLEKEGVLTTETVVPDIFCHKTYNAASLIVWKKRTRKA